MGGKSVPSGWGQGTGRVGLMRVRRGNGGEGVVRERIASFQPRTKALPL